LVWPTRSPSRSRPRRLGPMEWRPFLVVARGRTCLKLDENGIEEDCCVSVESDHWLWTTTDQMTEVLVTMSDDDDGVSAVTKSMTDDYGRWWSLIIKMIEFMSKSLISSINFLAIQSHTHTNLKSNPIQLMIIWTSSLANDRWYNEIRFYVLIKLVTCLINNTLIFSNFDIRNSLST